MSLSSTTDLQVGKLWQLTGLTMGGGICQIPFKKLGSDAILVKTLADLPSSIQRPAEFLACRAFLNSFAAKISLI